MRINNHPILGEEIKSKEVEVIVDGKIIKAYEGEMIASALVASGIKIFRYTSKYNEPRGLFCAIGRCTDCVMEVNGKPNVRTCVTPVEVGMVINTQKGLGNWKENKN
ncbi:MAG: (2Fe-2S)-binding protein [Actinobacteria bacterium]|nr:(2Fe-2S)-binding protein [Actinomycetota bacterium]